MIVILMRRGYIDFQSIAYLPIAIGMSYGTSFSDCKYISQIRVTKYFIEKKSIWNHFNDMIPLHPH